mgnify:CR=1 FL=1
MKLYLLKEFNIKKVLILLTVLFLVYLFNACGYKNLDSTMAPVSSIESSEKVNNTGANETRSFTDTAGRTITVPVEIKKVYSINPIGNVMMYTLAPQKIAGLSSKVQEDDKKFLLESYITLPVLSGSFWSDKTMNTEEILKAEPDVIINMGNVDHTSVDDSQRIQEQLGIPVAVIRFDIKTMGDSYKLLGELIGEKSRAQQLGDYCTKTINEIYEKTLTIPENKKIKVYYAEGEKGLQTDPKGSPHSEVLDLVGAINVADIGMTKGFGRSTISVEQLLKWNPDRIIVCIDAGTKSENNPFNFILNNSTMAKLDAVKNKRVTIIPYHPFNWIDRPASVNRIIGAKWLANLLYPDIFKYDIREETTEFYEMFYHRKLTEEEVDEILGKIK